MKTIIKQKAIIFRKRGFSLKEIAKKLDISQSTASLWLRKVRLNKTAQRRLKKRSEQGRERAVKNKKIKRDEIINGISKNASQVIDGINFNQNLIKYSCALLYWSEGEKNSPVVNFTNSDPAMIQSFVWLLREGFSLKEEKFRICLHLHSYHKEKQEIRFWSKMSNIPKARFIKIFKKQNSGLTKKPNYHGCASVRYYDYKIANELRLIWEDFIKKLGA